MNPRIRTPLSSANRHAGFTIVELLIGMAITLLLAGALAGAVQPARDAFERLPAALESLQRGRTAIDAIALAVRSAREIVWLHGTDESGESDALTAIVPVNNGGYGRLIVDQGTANGAITLDATPCPNIRDLCAFTAGSTAMIADADGHSEVFTVAATNPGARRLTSAGALARAYVAGSVVVEVNTYRFFLAEQPDGSHSLVRETAAGAIQPVADLVEALSFGRGNDDEVFVSLTTGGRVYRTAVRIRTTP